jgi:hypothetical protein
VAAAKAHVPGCEEWGKDVDRHDVRLTELADRIGFLNAIIIPPEQRPYLDELIEGICFTDMVGVDSP